MDESFWKNLRVKAAEIAREASGTAIIDETTKAAIDKKIERAIQQFERGEFLTAEESRADMARRKAAWLRDR